MLNPVFLSYYSVPTFVFYPLLIVIFGINSLSLIVMGAMFGIVAMISATLASIDRIPRVYGKVARVGRLGRWQTAIRIQLPAAMPHLITGIKLAVAYSVIGVIAGEFIISTSGLGRRLKLAYNDFDTPAMYGLILLIFIAVAIVNSVLQRWEVYLRWIGRRGNGHEGSAGSDYAILISATLVLWQAAWYFAGSEAITPPVETVRRLGVLMGGENFWENAGATGVAFALCLRAGAGWRVGAGNCDRRQPARPTRS